MLPAFVAQIAHPVSIEKPVSPSYPVGSLEASTAIIAIVAALATWLRAELKTKSTAADAETALIKSLQQELADKDEEIDKQRVLIWRLEKEVRLLKQTMEFSGSFSQSEKINS